MMKTKITRAFLTIITAATMWIAFGGTNVYATIGGESMERQFRESMLRNNPHLKPEDIVCCGYFDANGNEVTRDEFAVLITQAALDGASPEYRATHSVTSEGIIVNNATGLPDPVDAKGRPITGNTVKKTQKDKVTATFTNLYGVIIGTSKITKGTDIAQSQFPAETPSDIVTDSGTLVFDHWDYDGKVLEEDVRIKAVYKYAEQ